MAEVRAAAGDVRGADDWIARAEAAGGDPAVVNLRVGRAFALNGRPSDAVGYLGAASAAAPGRPEIDYAYGEALLDAGRPADAIPHLRAAVAAGVRSDVAGADLVRALTAVGDRRGAREALEHVAPANAGDARSWMALGDLAVTLDAPELEERFYARAAAAAPVDPVAQLNLAVALAQSGHLDDARQHASEALRLNPGYEKARRVLDALARMSGRAR